MKKKIVLLSPEQLVYKNPERLDVFYSDGRLYYRVGIKSVEVGAANKDIKGVVDIPSEVTINGRICEVICVGNFQNCHHITSVRIPHSVNWLNRDLFFGCSGLEEIIVSKLNKKFDSRDKCNAIIETANDTLVVGCKTTVIPLTSAVLTFPRV
jgi:hypothetical protein